MPFVAALTSLADLECFFAGFEYVVRLAAIAVQPLQAVVTAVPVRFQFHLNECDD